MAIFLFKDVLERSYGHRCGIARFLRVGEGGIADTFGRISRIVALVSCKGVECVKATQPVGVTKVQLIATHHQRVCDMLKALELGQASAAELAPA